MFLEKIPTIIAITEANILGLFSKSNPPLVSINIPGKIIAGKNG